MRDSQRAGEAASGFALHYLDPLGAEQWTVNALLAQRLDPIGARTDPANICPELQGMLIVADDRGYVLQDFTASSDGPSIARYAWP